MNRLTDLSELFLDRPQDPRPHVRPGESEEVRACGIVGAQELREAQRALAGVAAPTRGH